MAKTPLALVVVLLCAASLAAADLGSARDLTPQQESAETIESTSRSDDTTSTQPDTSGYQAARQQSAESLTAVPDASPTGISLLVLPSTAESLVADVDTAEGDELQAARNRRSRLVDSMQSPTPNSESTAAPPLQPEPSAAVAAALVKPQASAVEPQLAGRDTNPGGAAPSGSVSAGAAQASPLSVDAPAAAPPLQVDHAPPSTAVPSVVLSTPPLQRLAAEDTQETGAVASPRVAPEPLPSPVRPTQAQPDVDASPLEPPPQALSTSAPVVPVPLPAPAPEAEPDRATSQLIWHEVPRDVGTERQPLDAQDPPSDRTTAAPSWVSEDSDTIRSELQQPRHAASQISAAVISVGSGGSRLAADGSGSEAYGKDPVVGRPFRGNATISDKRLPKPTRTPKSERGTTSSASHLEFRLLTAAGVAGLVIALVHG